MSWERPVDRLAKRTMTSPCRRGDIMMIDCDRNMIVHLLRNWHPNRLLPKGIRLSRDGPRFMALQGGVCAICGDGKRLLTNDGKATHLDHIVTVRELADRVLEGELVFDDAYRQLWDDSNVRASHRSCNYARNKRV